MVKLKDLLKTIEYVSFEGNQDLIIHEVIPISDSRHSLKTLTWIRSFELDVLDSIKESTLICPANNKDKLEELKKRGMNLIISINPRRTFLHVLKNFELMFPRDIIEPSAQIHSSTMLGSNCYIGHNVIVEENCVIGNNTIILHNTVLRSGTVIGHGVKIGCNSTIGGVGFGYELLESGEYELIPHIGGVIVEDVVEIGNNSCIDRAVLGNTIVRRNVKIDNLVHIAHGCDIGENSLVIANSMIAGSVKVGRNSWIAPSSSILNKLNIGNDTVIGMGAIVIRDVQEGDVIAGNPGKVIKKKII